jgi:pimeloyl-ACP methyl ester carboxylesterase
MIRTSILFAVAAIVQASPVSLPTGSVIDEVKCEADPSHSYALYLPRAFTTDRTWPVIIAFDPGGRGRTPVERYQDAAEQYGFIVAGSNNSRNGVPNLEKIITTLTTDVLTRLPIDPKRIYTAGMSGGSRVALLLALGAKDIAGAIASSAGYPDSKPRKTVPFPIFATAGTEDFNHIEMRLLDRALTTPHRVVIFNGGHAWLSSDLAVEAVEWMELQAIKTGRKPRDEAQIDRIFAKRLAGVDRAASEKERYVELQSVVADFTGLRDVTPQATTAAALGRDKAVRDALKRDVEEDDRELRILEEVRVLESRLGADDTHARALLDLRQRWKELAEKAGKREDSQERRFARRVLANLSAGTTSSDPDYLQIVNEYRPRRGRL